MQLICSKKKSNNYHLLNKNCKIVKLVLPPGSRVLPPPPPKKKYDHAFSEKAMGNAGSFAAQISDE